MGWLASKSVMALCGLGVVLVAAGVATWSSSGAELVAVGGGVLVLWLLLQVRTTRSVGLRPGRGLVPSWMADQRLPRARRLCMAIAYLAAVGLLAFLAALWPTLGGVAGMAGLVGMFAVVAVLDLVVRQFILGPIPTEPPILPTDLRKKDVSELS